MEMGCIGILLRCYNDEGASKFGVEQADRGDMVVCRERYCAVQCSTIMRIRRKTGVPGSQTRACLSLILASTPPATAGDEGGSRWNTLYDL